MSKTIANAVITLAVAGIGFGTVAVPQIVTVHTLNGATDLVGIHYVQQLSIANDGLYAPTLDSLISAEFGQAPEFRQDSHVAYLVNADRTHYVAATILPSGEVAVRSDESGAVLCESYTVECVAQVTADAELLAAVPAWVSF